MRNFSGNEVSDWEQASLLDVANYYNGIAFKETQWTESGLPIIRIEQLNNSEAPTDYYNGDVPPQHHVSKGDLIFSWSATLKAVIWRSYDGVLNQHLFKVQPKSNISKSFLRYVLEHNMDAISSTSQGSTMKHVTRRDLSRYKIRIPTSVKTQRAIARILATLDDTIEQTEALIAKHQQIKAGLMHDLFTRGVTPDGRLRPSRDEAPQLYKESPLGWIPKEWEVAPLGLIALFITSGSRGWAEYYSESGPIFVRIGNLTREHINFRWNQMSYVQPPMSSEGTRTAVLPGDILVSITADLGIVGVAPSNLGEAYVNQHIALIRLKNQNGVERFIGHFMSTPLVQNQFSKLDDSGAKAGLNLSALGRIQVAIPRDHSEIAHVAKMLDSLDAAVSELKLKLEKSKQTKQGLMHDLLTGRVRVPTTESIEAHP